MRPKWRRCKSPNRDRGEPCGSSPPTPSAVIKTMAGQAWHTGHPSAGSGQAHHGGSLDYSGPCAGQPGVQPDRRSRPFASPFGLGHHAMRRCKISSLVHLLTLSRRSGLLVRLRCGSAYPFLRLSALECLTSLPCNSPNMPAVHPAESSSSSYGPTFRLRLLPTPPHGDAVTFSYEVVASSDRDFHPAGGALSWAHSKPLRGKCRAC